MACVALKEITGAKAFFRARGSVNSKANPVHDQTLQQSFADGLLVMLNSAKMGPTDATQLVEALNDSPYGEEQTARIRSHIDTIMVKSHTAVKLELVGSGRQLLKTWWNYLTQAEWERLGDPKVPFSAKLTMMVERGLSVGCIEPDEKSLGWCLATIFVKCYDELPSAQASYAKLQELKACYVSERKAFMHEQLSMFPDDPIDLPAHIFKYAYPDSGGEPITVVLNGINTVFDLIPLRKNSKLLKHNTAARATAAAAFADRSQQQAQCAPVQQPQTPCATVQQPSDPDELVLYYDYQRKLAELRSAKRKAQSPSTPPTLTIHRASDGTLKAQPLDATAEHDVAVKREATSTDRIAYRLPAAPAAHAAPTEADLDPYTQAAIKALQNRDASKAAEASDKKVVKPIMKKPASCPSSTPSAAPKPKAVLKKVKKAEAVKAEPVVISKGQIMTSMPKLPADGSNPAPVPYGKGIIYTSRRNKSFRALRVRGNNYTESSRSWGGDKPAKAAWVSCVKAIDEGK